MEVINFVMSNWHYVLVTLGASILLSLPLLGTDASDGAGAAMVIIILGTIILLCTYPVYAGIYVIFPVITFAAFFCKFLWEALRSDTPKVSEEKSK